MCLMQSIWVGPNVPVWRARFNCFYCPKQYFTCQGQLDRPVILEPLTGCSIYSVITNETSLTLSSENLLTALEAIKDDIYIVLYQWCMLQSLLLSAYIPVSGLALCHDKRQMYAFVPTSRVLHIVRFGVAIMESTFPYSERAQSQSLKSLHCRSFQSVPRKSFSLLCASFLLDMQLVWCIL